MNTIKIKYIGDANIRLLDDLRWDPENNHLQDVPLPMAATLLTYPRPGEFALADGEDAEAVRAAIDEFISQIPSKTHSEMEE